MSIAACGSHSQETSPDASTGVDASVPDASSMDAGPGCTIAGHWYGDGTIDPGDVCHRCEVGVSASDWTDLPDGTSCGTGMTCFAGWCGDHTELVASNVDYCALNATDVFCFSASSAEIWRQAKTGGSQTTVAPAAKVSLLAADDTYVIAIEGDNVDPRPFRVPVTGGPLTAIADAVPTSVGANPIVLAEPMFYFVAIGAPTYPTPTIIEMNMSQTSNAWTPVDTMVRAYGASRSDTGPIYVKNAQILPGNVALPTSFTAWGVGADQDSYYVSGNISLSAMNKTNEVIKISRADGSTTTLASNPINVYTWAEMFVGQTYVYWLGESGLSRVNKHQGPIETITSNGAPLAVMLDDQYVWWVGPDRKLYRRPQ
jgi:hypothetical protein